MMSVAVLSWVSRSEDVMREVGAFEAKNTLGALLDLVQGGEEVLIKRHGKPVARLVPETRIRDVAAAMAAVERIRARRANRIGPPITIEEIIAWKNEGRR